MSERENETRDTGADEQRGLVADLLTSGALGAAAGAGKKAGEDAYAKAKEMVRPAPEPESPIVLPPAADRD